MINGYTTDSAMRDNAQLRAESLAYRSTTEPLQAINKTLIEIKDLLDLLVDALVEK